MLLPAVFRLSLAAWLVYVALYDRRTWTVPWWTTWPVILAAGLGHLARGAWAPLALMALCFVWDTTVGDLKRLFRRRCTPADDLRWLISDLAAWLLTFGLLAVARQQEPTVFVFTAGYALVHLLWRLGWLPGGDAALLIALIALFPSLTFLMLASVIVATLALALLLWRRRHDLTSIVRLALTAGPWAALRACRTQEQPEPVAWLFAAAGLVGLVWQLT